MEQDKQLVPVQPQGLQQGFTQEQIEKLRKPLLSSDIRTKPKGNGLSYIRAKTAYDHANEIFGFGQWGTKLLGHSLEQAPTGAYYYTCDIELYVVGALYPMIGDGVGEVIPLKDGTTPVECFDKARKESTTDAEKRALRHYGEQFGLSLYDQDALVEDSQGNLIPVHDVPQHIVGKSPAKPKQTVEGSTHIAPPPPVTPTVTKPTVVTPLPVTVAAVASMAAVKEETHGAELGQAQRESVRILEQLNLIPQAKVFLDQEYGPGKTTVADLTDEEAKAFLAICKKVRTYAYICWIGKADPKFEYLLTKGVKSIFSFFRVRGMDKYPEKQRELIAITADYHQHITAKAHLKLDALCEKLPQAILDETMEFINTYREKCGYDLFPAQISTMPTKGDKAA